MIKIVICDDEVTERNHLEQTVRNYFRSMYMNEYQIEQADSGEKLFEVLKEKSFDIYFMDVKMPGIDGIEIGREIRRMDQKAVIIYITAFREYAFEAYGIGAYQYLQKPVEEKELYSILDRVVDILQKEQKRKICIHTKEGLANVDMNEIMYVENISRAAVYFLRGDICLNGVCNRSSFEKSVWPLNELHQFLHPHKSYFVNMFFIRNFGSKNLELENGEQIPVSRKRLVEAKRRYLEFLSEQGGSF